MDTSPSSEITNTFSHPMSQAFLFSNKVSNYNMFWFLKAFVIICDYLFACTV